MRLVGKSRLRMALSTERSGVSADGADILRADVHQIRPLDPPHGARAAHDRAVRGPPGHGGRHFVSRVVLPVPQARRAPVPDLHPPPLRSPPPPPLSPP